MANNAAMQQPNPTISSGWSLSGINILGVAMAQQIARRSAFEITVFGSRTGNFATSPNFTDVADFALETVQSSRVFAALAGTEELEAISTSANDTSAGSGVQTLRVSGLDANWDMQTQIVTLNGTTAVSLGSTRWRAINSIESATLGTARGGGAGTITVRRASDDQIVAQINAGGNRSSKSEYTIPRGYTGYVTQFFGSYVATNPGTVAGTFSLRVDASELTNEKQDGIFQSRLRTLIPGGSERDMLTAVIVPAECTVKGAVIASGADSTAAIGMMIVVVQNEA